MGFVADARAAVARGDLYLAVHLELGRTVENFDRREGPPRRGRRLGIILAMLTLAFGNLRYALAVFTGVPFALVGGIVALKLRAMTFSIPAAVGFIALAGIAVFNGVVMASAIRRRRWTRAPGATPPSSTGPRRSSRKASSSRRALTPWKLRADGGEHLRGERVSTPLATVVGLASSTALDLPPARPPAGQGGADRARRKDGLT
ncbi:MAG: efflux RND transporter permease subunit [Polyangiales bacterium]